MAYQWYESDDDQGTNEAIMVGETKQAVVGTTGKWYRCDIDGQYTPYVEWQVAAGPTPDYPPENKVVTGTAYDGGNLNGNVILPEEHWVYTTIGYGANGTEFTGTNVMPVEADVRAGLVYGTAGGLYELTGELVLPEVADVRLDVTYGYRDEFVGTLVEVVPNYPTESQVLDGVTFGNENELIGNVDLPPVESVLNIQNYGPLNSLIGTYASPSATRVISGISYGPDFSYQGVFAYPLDSEVLDGVGYGANGTQYVGTLDPATAAYPSPDDVRLDTTYGDDGQFVGNCRVPEEKDVRLDVPFDTNDSLTGRLDPGAGDDLPVEDDVRFGVVYASGKTGLLVSPVEPTVLIGVGYGASGIEFTGTLTDVPGGSASPLGPVIGSGALRNPLIIGNAYTADFAFLWQIDSLDDFDPLTAVVVFRGWNPCNCGVDEWNTVGRLVDNGTTWDLIFDLDSDVTEGIQVGLYDWAVEIDDLRVTGSFLHFQAEWVC